MVGLNTNKANLLLKAVGHPLDFTNKLALSLTEIHTLDLSDVAKPKMTCYKAVKTEQRDVHEISEREPTTVDAKGCGEPRLVFCRSNCSVPSWQTEDSMLERRLAMVRKLEIR